MRYNNVLELAAATLVEILSPLKSRMHKTEFRRFLGELGLPLPASVESVSTIGTDTKAIIDTIDPLIQGLEKLFEAIKDTDTGKIVSESKSIFNEIKPVFDNIKNLANTIKTLHTVIGGLNASQLNTFANQLPEKIFDYLVVSNFEKIDGLTETLEFIGAVERSRISVQFPEEANPYEFVAKDLEIGNLFNFIKNPAGHLGDLYDWGTTQFNGTKLFPRMESILGIAGVPAIYDPATKQLDIGFIEFGLTTDSPIKGIEAIFKENIPLNGSQEITEGDWHFKLETAIQLALQLKMGLLHDFKVRIDPPAGSITGLSTLEWGTAQKDTPYILIGEQEGSRLQIKSFQSKFDLNFKTSTVPGSTEALFKWLNTIDDGKLIIDNRNSDGFLARILPDLIESDFEFVIGWSSENGFIFDGSSALEIDIPVHLDLGPIEINTVHLGVGIGDQGLATSLGLTAKAELGPVKASVQNIGLTANFDYVGDGGNMGPIDAEFGFKFPEGIGVSVDASVVKGGGYLYIDVDKGEYAGVVELNIQNIIELKAIGIITTKLPNGEVGYSFLLLITAEFTPIQLGFGFSLNGVGGLAGINRGMNLQAIRDGVKNQTLDSILFPDDPVANAPQIISNLNSIFPIALENHSFGIMGIIGWGVPTLLNVELGVMITFPTFDIAVIGKISLVLPDESLPILSLNVAFAGTLSFEKKYLFFDAVIYDSKILTMSLSGSMALRILWGDEPNFVLTVGGFHPDFTPPPLGLDNLQRLTLNLLGGSNPRLTLKCYFAVTSNTVQFGAEIDFYFKVSKFKVIGFFYFHALFQFDPFYFNIGIGAGLAVKLGSSTILSVSVSGSLEGPTPWKVKGKGKFKIWFVKISVSFSKTWGENKDSSLPSIDISPKLAEAISDSRNWQGKLSGTTLATLRSTTEEGEEATSDDQVVVHPFSSLSFLQKVTPLDIKIAKFGNQEVRTYNKFSLSILINNSELGEKDIKDFYAPGQYFELSDSQKVSRKSYEKYNSGITADTTDELQASHAVQKEVTYESEVIDKTHPSKFIKIKEPLSHFTHWAKGSAIASSIMGERFTHRYSDTSKKVKYDQEDYVVVDTATMATKGAAGVGFTEVEAVLQMQEMILADPLLDGQIEVVPSYELT